MKTVSADAMRRLDEAASRDYGIPALILMENAGRAVADVIAREFQPCRVLVVAGKGNNGGDGFVAARHLANRAFSVRVALLEIPAASKPDTVLNYEILRKMALPFLLAPDALMSGRLERALFECDLVVDAIFGVGLHDPVTGAFQQAIRAINQSSKPVVSIDIPSGLDADTGRVLGDAVQASRTVTLALPKAGLFENEGPGHSGKIEIVDIGIPLKLTRPFLD